MADCVTERSLAAVVQIGNVNNASASSSGCVFSAAHGSRKSRDLFFGISLYLLSAICVKRQSKRRCRTQHDRRYPAQIFLHPSFLLFRISIAIYFCRYIDRLFRVF